MCQIRYPINTNTDNLLFGPAITEKKKTYTSGGMPVTGFESNVYRRIAFPIYLQV